MKCCFCNEEMIEGLLIGDRYSNIWEPKDKSISPRTIYLKKQKKIYKAVQNTTFFCHRCNKLIIDLDTEENRERRLL